MGAALDAIGDVGTALRRSPTVIAAAAIAGLILLVGALLTFIPLVGQLIYSILIVPVVLVGLVAMVDGAIQDGAGLGAFVDGMREHGPNAIGAYAIMFVIQVGTIVVFTLVAVAAGIGVFSALTALNPGEAGGGMGAPAGGSLLVFSVLLLAILLVAAILGLIQTFLDVAVVIGGQTGMDALREAVAVITDGPLSTLGYLLVRGIVTLVAAIVPLGLFVGGVAVMAGGVGEGSVGGPSVVFFLLGALLLPLPFAASFAYHAGYYRRRRGGSPRTTPEPTERGRRAEPDRTRTAERSRSTDEGARGDPEREREPERERDRTQDDHGDPMAE